MSEPTAAPAAPTAPANKPTPRKAVKHADSKRSAKAKRASKTKRQAVAVKFAGPVAVGIRVKHTKVTGGEKGFPSVMMRVSLDFANLARREAVKHGISVAEATRAITEMVNL